MKKTFFALLLAFAAISANAAKLQPAWEPAGDHIKSRWAAKVNPNAPLPEYPRPQMVRSNWQNLNGLWNYAITPATEDSFTSEGRILVPFAVESSLSGVGRTVGKENALWYERTFNVPVKWKGQNILLHFGAVDWKAEVWVNGTKVGEHTGGYTPFTFDITSALKPIGKQTIRVKVWDATDNSFQPRGKQVNVPTGIWYTPVTGIWQTVWMEPVPETHIVSYNAESLINKNAICLDVDAAGLKAGDEIIAEAIEGKTGYSAEAPGDKVVASATVLNGKAVLPIAEMKLWDPDSPYLYGIRIKILRNGKVIDKIDGYTAMRKIGQMTDSWSYKRLTLNDKPIFMFGPLDQGWWPDGLYTAPTEEAMKYDIEKTKQWGWNMIRKHIKVEPARWYYWCDVLGICVWQDMPSIGDHSAKVLATRDPRIAAGQRNKWSSDSFLGGTDAAIPQAWKDNYYVEWADIINSLKCFPCICVWVPFNEAWGQFDTPKAVALTRKLDPSRLVNEASGGNFALCGDIQDCHHYPHPMMRAFEGKLVNVVGEYGGIGFPVKGHLWQNDANWGYGAVKTSGAQVLKDYAQYAEMLKTLIKTGCSAGVYTQTTDVEIEVNGIMTYDRAIVKVDEAEFARINRSVIDAMREYDITLLSYKQFKRPEDKNATTLHTIRGGRLTMQVSTLGARVVSLWAPDRRGNYDDIEIGYENHMRYLHNSGERYLGAAVGPVANRIGKGVFSLGGKRHNTPLNNNGNTLHGGTKGVDMVYWKVEESGDDHLVLSLDLPDGQDGFPGNRHIEMKYQLTDNNEFIVTYKATTDKPTPINLSHHSFFNLTGRANKSILGHILRINASKTTPVDSLLIPSGEIASLDGSPLDFRQPKEIGRDINVRNAQLKNGCGYDHNWCLDRKTASDVEFAASVYEPESGRYMEVWTDQPGLQFYSGNFFDGSYNDKYGRPIIHRGAIALETQKFPDAVNHPNFPSTILKPGETYTQTCIYRFSTK